MRLEQARLGGQRRVEVVQRGGPPRLPAVEPGQRPVRRRPPGGVPGRLGQRVVRLGVPVQPDQGQPQPVVRLAVVGVRVAQGLAGDGCRSRRSASS